MHGRQDRLPDIYHIGNQKEQRNNEASNFTTLEETLRELIATSNGTTSKSVTGETIVTGGPPPAKPFPGMHPANINNDPDVKVCRV